MRDLQEIKRDNAIAQINAFKARFRRAIELMPNGFTLDSLGHTVNRDSGYAVAVRSFETLDSLVTYYKGLLANPDEIDFFFGYWKNEGREYFETTKIYEGLFIALDVAEILNQRAIYSFAEKRDIYV